MSVDGHTILALINTEAKDEISAANFHLKFQKMPALLITEKHSVIDHFTVCLEIFLYFSKEQKSFYLNRKI